jgi:transcriptional regulator with XRE-family HTH domain
LGTSGTGKHDAGQPSSRAAALELGRFLRSRRERISPEETGLIVAGRRRTPGLRREEVAVLAGMSTTWYTYLEQGRGREVSLSVLDSIARVFRLTDDERQYIHTLAHLNFNVQGTPSADGPPYDAETVEALKQIVAGLNSYPYPVYVVDYMINILAWNEASKAWYDDWDSFPAAERNFLAWLLTNQQARECCVDWEDVVLEIIARWRLQLSRIPPRRDVIEFIHSLHSSSPEFTSWWDKRDVREHRMSLRRLRHSQLGTQSMRVVYLKTSHEENPVIVFHLPLIHHSPVLHRASNRSLPVDFA